MPSSGLQVAGSGATFVASGKKPEFGMIVASASASTACNLTVTEIVQTAVNASSDITTGLSVLTQRSLDLQNLNWTVQYQSSEFFFGFFVVFFGFVCLFVVVRPLFVSKFLIKPILF